MAKRIEVYPKLVVRLEVADDFDESVFQSTSSRWTLTAMRAVQRRLRKMFKGTGMTLVAWHIHTDTVGSVDEPE